MRLARAYDGANLRAACAGPLLGGGLLGGGYARATVPPKEGLPVALREHPGEVGTAGVTRNLNRRKHLDRCIHFGEEPQFVDAGFCRPKPRLALYLAAGKIYRGDEDRLTEIFAKRGWTLWGPSFIRSELEKLQDSGYENTVAAVCKTAPSQERRV